jgi:hypothetical protein
VVEKLSAEVNKAMQSPDIKDFFAALGFNVQGSTPEAFKAFVERGAEVDADREERGRSGELSGGARAEPADLVSRRPIVISRRN